MMPLNNSHFEEIVADIKEQYRRGVATCPIAASKHCYDSFFK
jgi:hypothetical protein